jgi:hypothetical protein
VERIFGKRPWTSRTEEILALNAEEQKETAGGASTDDANADIIRQKAIDAVIEKAKQAEAEQKAADGEQN